MEKERVWREFAALSEKDQRKVVDFIVSLRKEDDTTNSADEKPSKRLEEESFVGIWERREDMQDSGGWLRELRKREWMRSDG